MFGYKENVIDLKLCNSALSTFSKALLNINVDMPFLYPGGDVFF
jgi:hypothetical protein